MIFRVKLVFRFHHEVSYRVCVLTRRVCYALSASIEKYPLNLLEIFLQNRLEMAKVKNNTLPEKWEKQTCSKIFEKIRKMVTWKVPFSESNSIIGAATIAIFGKIWEFFQNFVLDHCISDLSPKAGNTKAGSIIIPLTSCLTGLELPVGQLTIFVFIFKKD